MASPNLPPDRFAQWNARVRDVCKTVRDVTWTLTYAGGTVMTFGLTVTGHLPAGFDDVVRTVVDALVRAP
jgi:hypothetical protein